MLQRILFNFAESISSHPNDQFPTITTGGGGGGGEWWSPSLFLHFRTKYVVFLDGFSVAMVSDLNCHYNYKLEHLKQD